ncbi:MAG TPA: stage V sporulation protein AA [Bacillales bacterium]|nr:stage V sporulation protein AA [Bacillales bacterium]
MKPNTVYVRMRHHVLFRPNQQIRLGHLAEIVGPAETKNRLSELVLHHIEAKDRNFLVMEDIQVIEAIHRLDATLDVQMVGPSQTIVEVRFPKKSLAPVLFCAVWVLLFIGAALAIMNFHEDVSMGAVHQEIFQIVTGKKLDKPLILQIPYSFGIGIGMILFFNHLFRKKFNEEPSPLEVEMFNYQQDLDRYIAYHEKSPSGKKR